MSRRDMEQAALDKSGDLIRWAEDVNGLSPEDSLTVVNQILARGGSGDEISLRSWHHYRAGDRQPSRRRLRAISEFTDVPVRNILDGEYEFLKYGVWWPGKEIRGASEEAPTQPGGNRSTPSKGERGPTRN